MSLIICEECGREISDKAKACPHCGAPVENAETKVEKHGSDETSECLTVEKGETVIVDTALKKKKKKTKLIIIIIVIIVALIAGAAFGVVKYKEKKAKEKYDNAVNQMRSSALLMNLEVNDTYGLSEEADTVEELINLTNSVWHDAVFNESSKKTKKYVSGAKDFNEAVDNVYSDSNISEYVSKLTDLRDEFKKKKIDCPNKLLSVKDKYDDMFAAFSALVDYAEYPSGSYNTYMEHAQEKFDEFNTAYSKFDSACPEMKKSKKDKEEDN